MSLPDTVGADDSLRLFLALRLPDVALDCLSEWARRELPGVRLVPRGDLHVTLAFLGRTPPAELDGIVAALTASAEAAAAIAFDVGRWRETRSVGMVVLADRGGAAAALADDLHSRLEGLGVYRRERRAWLPHVTVCRFRTPPRLSPPPPAMGTCVPSDAAAYVSRLHPSGARYDVIATAALGQREGVTIGRREEKR